MDDKILELTGALIGLVRATDGNMKSIERVKEILTEGLFAMSGCMETLDETALKQMIDKRYTEYFEQQGIKKILKYGIACRVKECKVMLEEN